MIPWLRLIDGVLGARDIARAARPRGATSDPSAAVDTPLAGVVIGALREAFTRDSARLDLERQRLDDERARAERALQMELLRQAGEREVSRLRLMGGAALFSLFGALFLATRLPAAAGTARTIAGIGVLMLLAAVGAAFAGHAQVSRQLALAHAQTVPADVTAAPAAKAVPWLFLSGLAALAIGIIVG